MMWWNFLIVVYFFTLEVSAIQYIPQIIHQKKLVNNNEKLSKESLQNDDLCNLELSLFKQELENKSQWAVKFVDTWAKIQAGYLSGNLINIGDFDSCVNFQHELNSDIILQGQHCFVTLSALPNSTLGNDISDFSLKNLANFFRSNEIFTTNGFCMPTTCSSDKVLQFLNNEFLFKNDLIAHEASCWDFNKVDFEPLDYFAVAIFSFFTILIIMSTTYEIIISKYKKSEPNKLLGSFSFYTNGYKLFEMTKIKSPSSINCLHGLRAMSIFWIILGHRITNQSPWGNPNDVKNFVIDGPLLASIINAHTLAVDTFFVMGASLMTWTTLRDYEKQQLNILRMIWRRYIRYTPVYAALILSVISFSKILLQGPYYMEELWKPCIDNWWLTLLHIQNFLHNSEMCLNHGWYLSADFQLFVISPLIIWLIHKYGRKMLLVPAILCIGTIIYIILISIVYNIQMPSPVTSEDYAKFIYFPTQARAGPWFTGIILGYFLYANKGKKIRISKIFNGFMWIVSLSTLISIVLVTHGFVASKEPIQAVVHISFLALQRNLWAVAICWIIFACQNFKTGGIVRWFLSLPQWQPISRMGLSMYLVGAVYQVLMILNQRVPLYMNFWHIVPILLSDVVGIFMLSTISYLAFEAPPLIIEDYFYKMSRNK